MKRIKPLKVNKDGSVAINLHGSSSNDDWLFAARLKKAAENGDEVAARKFKEMDESDMVEDVE